ncbi:MAG: hypothetical protein FD141_736 [Fusobacteria bacterium]|nr:MAG: hypothetical protein FD141_736 [Fusobacteriota bacterium]KAF0228598.1 MAG: hypothetical protein FD182_854 [Fusobacteriota bacterium]
MMWDNYGYDMMGGGWSWLIFILWIIGVFIVIALVVWFIVKLVKSNSVKSQFDNDKSLTILNERLAKGEITMEEYTKFKNIIAKG